MTNGKPFGVAITAGRPEPSQTPAARPVRRRAAPADDCCSQPVNANTIISSVKLSGSRSAAPGRIAASQGGHGSPATMVTISKGKKIFCEWQDIHAGPLIGFSGIGWRRAATPRVFSGSIEVHSVSGDVIKGQYGPAGFGNKLC